MARKPAAKPAAQDTSEAPAFARAAAIVGAFDISLGRGPRFPAADAAWLIEHPNAPDADFWAVHVAADAGAGGRAYPYAMLSPIDKARIAIFMAAVLAG
jgi:hypothetical protein